MKRIYKNSDIEFRLKNYGFTFDLLELDSLNLQFFTKDSSKVISKSKQDVINGNVILDWKDLSTLEEGILYYSYNVAINDGRASDLKLNKVEKILTDYYVVSGIIPTPEPEDKNNYYTKIEVDNKLEDKADKTELPTKVSLLVNDKGYLTEHQSLKTINGESIIGNGDIIIEGGGSSLDFNKPMPSVSIAGSWSYFNNVEAPVESLSSSLNPTIERGYKAQFRGIYKWTASKESKKPTAVTSSSNWQDLPSSSGVNSKEYISSKISSNTTIKAEISAAKTGLMIKGNDVVAAEGLDYARSSISIAFKDRIYQGNSATDNITQDILKGLSNTLVTSKSQTFYNVNTKKDMTYYVYAYPTRYGVLTSVLLGTYEVLSAFNKSTLQVTNSSGYSADYFVYVSTKKGAYENVTLKFN